MVFNSELERFNAFCEVAMLNQKYDPWVKRRQEGESYANIFIFDKGHDFGPTWKTWWEDYLPIECFARIRFEKCEWTGNVILKEAFPVRLTNTKITEGRSIKSAAFILI